MKLFKLISWICLILIIFISAGCGSSGSDSSETITAGKGTLSLGLTDASTEDYHAVYVTIKEVQVHFGEETGDEGEDHNNWFVVATPNQTYNLLELVNGVIQQLGLTDLEVGHYTQMRMMIGDSADDGLNINGDPHPFANYIIDHSDVPHELEIPSGYETGVKIVHGFDIAEGQITELILDFDASKSVVKAGNSGQWILKPTIEVIDTMETAELYGIVAHNAAEVLGNVLVSAQKYDSDVVDIKDEVVSQTSTLTDENGSYFMYLWPGTYNIVYYLDGFGIGCARIVVESGFSYGQDVTLYPADTGTVEGEVSISGGEQDQEAVLSFRQDCLCDNNTVEESIEVKSKIVEADGGTYHTELPVGTYRLVASTSGKTSQEITGIEVTSGGAITLNIDF